MLNSSTVYCSLDCTSECHHITPVPEAQKKSAFVMQFGKFKFKKIPFGLVQALTHFQQLINKVLKSLPFAFGYLDDIFVFN